MHFKMLLRSFDFWQPSLLIQDIFAGEFHLSKKVNIYDGLALQHAFSHSLTTWKYYTSCVAMKKRWIKYLIFFNSLLSLRYHKDYLKNLNLNNLFDDAIKCDRLSICQLFFALKKESNPQHSLFDEYTCALAAECDRRDILRWLRQQQCPWDEMTTAEAATNLSLLQWLRNPQEQPEEICPWNAEVFILAALNGNIEVLQYLYDNQCPQDAEAYIMACHNFNTEVHHWLYEHSVPLSCDIMAAVVKTGSLPMCQWFYDRGCPWDENVCIVAVDYDFLEILQWLHEHQCPWNYQELCLLSINKHPQIFAWLQTQQ